MRLANWKILLLFPLMAGCAATMLMAQNTCFIDFSSGARDAQTTVQCAQRMEMCLRLMQRLREGARRQPDFLLPRDHDVLESLLADYISCRNELEQITRRQKSRDVELSRASLHCKTQSDLTLASLVVEDHVLGRALNQSFNRSGISRGSCDRILHEVTASKVALAGDAQERLNDIIHRRGWLLPAVENEFQHTQPLELFFVSGRAISAELQQGQHAFAARIGRIKNPIARTLAIADEQRRQIRNALQPGDVLLTYTEGLMSNLIVPGNFKHAATFVGTDAERRLAGLAPDTLLGIAAPNNHRLSRVLAQQTIQGGEAADTVESVADGVVLNNFDRILTSRVNLLVVLRPRLNHRERAEQVRDVLSYVGDRFDFSFDLTESSDLVCTEVVYRSLQGRGGIDLPLSVYAGRLTLTADDIARYALQNGGERFNCVLVVDRAPEAVGKARVLHAAEAQERMARLLGID